MSIRRDVQFLARAAITVIQREARGGGGGGGGRKRENQQRDIPLLVVTRIMQERP